MSRVRRRQEQTRARLTAAASALIAEHGVEGLRLRSIADAADVGFGSFYNYFASKDELVEAVVANAMATLATSVIATIRDVPDPAEALAIAHRWFLEQTNAQPQLARLIVQLDRADVLLEHAALPFVRPLLSAGMERGRFTPHDVDLVVTHAVGATIATMRSILEGRLRGDEVLASTRILMGTLGLSPEDAAEIAARPLPRMRDAAY